MFNPTEHHRRSIRRPDFDYAKSGWYFVTTCAQNRSCLFGDIVDGQLRLNAAGRMIVEVWNGLPERFANVTVDEFIVMPNHAHGVLAIDRLSDFGRGEPRVRPNVIHGTAEESIGRVMQAFKSITTKKYTDGVNNADWRRFSGRLWQRDYFDHVIRNDESLAAIRT